MKNNNYKLITFAIAALVIGAILSTLLISTVSAEKTDLTNIDALEITDPESRTNLILNLLKVNRIQNRNNNPLFIDSSNQLSINGDTYVSISSPNTAKLGSGNAVVKAFANGQEQQAGSKVEINANNFFVGHGGQSVFKIIGGANEYGAQYSQVIIETGVQMNHYLQVNNGLYADGANIGEHHNQPALQIVRNGQSGNYTSEITINAPTRFPNLSEGATNTGAIYHLGDTFLIENYTVEVMNIWDANNAVEMQLRNDVNGIIAEEVYSEGDAIFEDYLTTTLIVDGIDSDSVSIVIPSGNTYYACLTEDGTLFRSNDPCN
ncbi:MAG: hypothetical protein WCX82_04670 [archaeon]|jgi:hypothetical protein